MPSEGAPYTALPYTGTHIGAVCSHRQQLATIETHVKYPGVYMLEREGYIQNTTVVVCEYEILVHNLSRC